MASFTDRYFNRTKAANKYSDWFPRYTGYDLAESQFSNKKLNTVKFTPAKREFAAAFIIIAGIIVAAGFLFPPFGAALLGGAAIGAAATFVAPYVIIGALAAGTFIASMLAPFITKTLARFSFKSVNLFFSLAFDTVRNVFTAPFYALRAFVYRPLRGIVTVNDYNNITYQVSKNKNGGATYKLLLPGEITTTKIKECMQHIAQAEVDADAKAKKSGNALSSRPEAVFDYVKLDKFFFESDRPGRGQITGAQFAEEAYDAEIEKLGGVVSADKVNLEFTTEEAPILIDTDTGEFSPPPQVIEHTSTTASVKFVSPCVDVKIEGVLPVYSLKNINLEHYSSISFIEQMVKDHLVDGKKLGINYGLDANTPPEVREKWVSFEAQQLKEPKNIDSPKEGMKPDV